MTSGNGDEEMAKMRDVAKLLFGDDAGDGLVGLLGGGDADGFGLADRARRAGEWCGSTPGSGSALDAVRGAARPRGLRREMIISELDP